MTVITIHEIRRIKEAKSLNKTFTIKLPYTIPIQNIVGDSFLSNNDNVKKIAVKTKDNFNGRNFLCNS